MRDGVFDWFIGINSDRVIGDVIFNWCESVGEKVNRNWVFFFIDGEICILFFGMFIVGGVGF